MDPRRHLDSTVKEEVAEIRTSQNNRFLAEKKNSIHSLATRFKYQPINNTDLNVSHFRTWYNVHK
jgi:hypothetical protein